jgi:hypothetical protein
MNTNIETVERQLVRATKIFSALRAELETTGPTPVFKELLSRVTEEFKGHLTGERGKELYYQTLRAKANGAPIETLVNRTKRFIVSHIESLVSAERIKHEAQQRLSQL